MARRSLDFVREAVEFVLPPTLFENGYVHLLPLEDAVEMRAVDAVPVYVPERQVDRFSVGY